ncbi:AMP-binding protein [Lutibacter sp.]|uniref:AMP-binding protein n=1 Tax=Lutibacter sp. TaxID=1925666 RepID=UPI003564A61D
MDINQFHKAFKLQGKSFSSKVDLITFSEEISLEVFLFMKEWFDEKLFIEVKTSGSTGIPKVIQLQKKLMVNSALATGEFFNLQENTTALVCMPVNFIAGKMMLVRALVLGWHIDVVTPTSNPLKDIDKNYHFSAMVPLQLNNSLKNLHKIKKLIVGGGAVSFELLTKIQHIKTDVFATYGMTETITHIAIKKLNNFDSVISSTVDKSKNNIPSCAENDVKFRYAELVSASHYKTLPNIKLATDARGCLIINAPKISEEIILTNDLVELFSETEFKWLGRFDSVINSGGIKLIPEQIEEKIAEIVSQRFFVTGIPDKLLGEKLILIVEDESSKSESLKVSIFAKIQQLTKLNKYEIPKEIYVLDYFIETETKKINRQQTLNLLNLY